ncbi:hypothetical protein C478_03477 [Natrinema thermotolerans DSM 11552]|nr:hypothetical protein C478_03477 [Natrinema thermotolerans DSM 11552]
MTGSTALHGAPDCVDRELAAVATRDEAFGTFARRVRDLPATNPATGRGGTTAAAPVAMTTAGEASGASAATDGKGCVAVREAFAETVAPHSTADLADDEPLVETIAAELNEDVAVALAAETGWTPTLKRAVLEEIATRRREVDVVRETLETERETVVAAIDEVDEILTWLQSTAEESLLQCDFETLRAKHDRLECYRERLDELTARRQSQLTETTNRYGPGGTRYRTLVESVYSAQPARYPLLSTAARLYGVCGDCQRTVRAHLTRRV